MAEILISDWEKDGEERTITLDSALEPKDEIAFRFKQSKKLRTGLEYQAKHLEKTENEIRRHRADLERLDAIETLEDLHQFSQKAKIKLETPETPPKEKMPLPIMNFISEAGLKIWVGKTDSPMKSLHSVMPRVPIGGCMQPIIQVRM